MAPTDPTQPLHFEITQEDIDEARRLGLTGAELVARATRRTNPNIRSVKFSANNSEVEVEYGKPLD